MRRALLDGKREHTAAAGAGALLHWQWHNIGTEAFAVVVADVNHDKKSDLVAATVNSVTVLLGGSRGFVPAPGSPFSAGPGAYNVTVGDLNEDGKLDVAASSFEGNAVTCCWVRVFCCNGCSCRSLTRWGWCDH